jgi:hypothetical protein
MELKASVLEAIELIKEVEKEFHNYVDSTGRLPYN